MPHQQHHYQVATILFSLTEMLVLHWSQVLEGPEGGLKPWSNVMEILEEKDGLDTELLVYAMTLVNKTLAGLPDQDSFYDVVDYLEELGIEAVSQRHLNKKGADLDLVEQFNIYEMAAQTRTGTSGNPPSCRKDRRRASLGCLAEAGSVEAEAFCPDDQEHFISYSASCLSSGVPLRNAVRRSPVRE
uniref:Uncharacterized protein n=1 Tax=Sphaerodactylus townsendi TaxID=933632 RepID=A0ACB8FSY8_9SAUR